MNSIYRYWVAFCLVFVTCLATTGVWFVVQASRFRADPWLTAWWVAAMLAVLTVWYAIGRGMKRRVEL